MILLAWIPGRKVFLIIVFNMLSVEISISLHFSQINKRDHLWRILSNISLRDNYMMRKMSVFFFNWRAVPIWFCLHEFPDEKIFLIIVFNTPSNWKFPFFSSTLYLNFFIHVRNTVSSKIIPALAIILLIFLWFDC